MTDHLDEVTKKSARKKNKNSRFFEYLTTQLIVCLAVLLAAFVVKLIGGETYENLKQEYDTYFNDQTSASEVLQTIAGTFDLNIDDESSSSSGSSSAESNQSDVSGQVNEGESQHDDEGISSYSFSSSGDVTQADLDRTLDADSASAMIQTTGVDINALCMPVSGGTITAPYGYRHHPITGVYQKHRGIDIGADEGEDIYAAYDGTVKTALETDGDYGIYVIIDHGNGMETCYAHCSALTVEEGQTVKKGDVIAKAGSTGDSTGPHCHFEVRIGGLTIDPEWILRGNQT